MLTLDDSRLRRSLARLVDEFGLSAPDVIRTQMRLFLQQAIRFTPPKTLAQGRKAVSRDIRRAILPLREEDWREPKIKLLIRNQDKVGLTAMFANSPALRRWQAVEFSPHWHISARNKRGRVPRLQYRATWETKQLYAYIKEIQQRVGRMKAAWVPGLRAVAGNAAGWITRHSGAPGYYQNDLAKSNPSFTVANYAPGIGEYARAARYALSSRVKAVESDIQRRLREAARRNGL